VDSSSQCAPRLAVPFGYPSTTRSLSEVEGQGKRSGTGSSNCPK